MAKTNVQVGDTIRSLKAPGENWKSVVVTKVAPMGTGEPGVWGIGAKGLSGLFDNDDETIEIVARATDDVMVGDTITQVPDAGRTPSATWTDRVVTTIRDRGVVSVGDGAFYPGQFKIVKRIPAPGRRVKLTEKAAAVFSAPGIYEIVEERTADREYRFRLSSGLPVLEKEIGEVLPALPEPKTVPASEANLSKYGLDDHPYFSAKPALAYVAGPMSGIEEFNAPAFREAAKDLRERGFRVLSPVELDEDEGFIHAGEALTVDEEEYLGFLRRDLQRILSDGVQKIVVLPGWENSRGAAAEVQLGRLLGMEILSYPDLEPVKEPTSWKPKSDETILEEASRIVGGDRGDDYGHPRDDFARTAGAWHELFGWDVTPRQVALAMVVVKLSRLQETPGKRDSVVDIAGYARTYEMVAEKEAEELA